MNSQNKKHELGESLMDSIIEPNTDAMNDIAESLLDGLLEGTISEAAQEIPIIKSVVGIAKAGIGIKDYYFQKKLIRFLLGVNKTDKDICKKLGEAYKDKKAKQDFGEQILMTIDRLETSKKIDALIKLFSAFAKGEISQNEFFRYSYILENIDFNNLNILTGFYISTLMQCTPKDLEKMLKITESYQYNKNNQFGDFQITGTIQTVEGKTVRVSWKSGDERRDDHFLIQNFINVGLISITIGVLVSFKYDGKFFGGMSINHFGFKFLKILEILCKDEDKK
jgi:hypothetical protein